MAEMQEHEESIVRQAMMFNLPIPEHIQNAPRIEQGLEVYASAFLALVSCRPLGFGGVGPIPWTAVDRYADYLGLPREDREDFWYIIHEIDRKMLEYKPPELNQNGKVD